jgi:hypothetical protein
MKGRAKASSSRKGKGRGARSTTGRNDEIESGRKDYYVSNALEITPHANKPLVAMLKQPVMNRKWKYYVQESSISGIHTMSTVATSLVSISQGTTDITRTGDRVRVKKVQLKGKLYGNASQTGPTTARFVVFVWNISGVGQINPPSIVQVLQASAGYGPYGSYSRDYADQFQIVYDGIFSVEVLTASQPVDLIQLDRNVTIDMEFAAGAVQPMVNGVYAFLVTDVSANQPTVNYQSTIWFEDLDA